MPSPLVEFKNVRKRFGHLIVLAGVDLQVQPGESVVIIGASGSGKSVLLKHIVGLLRPDDGEVYFDGRRIDALPEKEIMPIRQRCGFIFKMGALFDSMPVGENIGFPLVTHTKKCKDEIAESVAQKLAMVGLPCIEKKLPGELSG